MQQLHDLLRLRSQVFVVEQACAYQDVDGLDLHPGTWHVLGHDEGRLVAYARILQGTPATAHSGAAGGTRIGRVVVHESQRGRQVGRDLMSRCLQLCARERPGGGVVLSAQAHLVGFYGGLGFVATSEEYDEDGIPHVDMQLTT